MANLFPVGGLPIRMVLPVLAIGPIAEIYRLYTDVEAIEPQEVLRSLVQALWSCVLYCEIEGRVRITGILPGEKRSEMLERGLLFSSTADFQRNIIQTAVGTVTGVMVHDRQVSVLTDGAPPIDPVTAAERWMAEHVTKYVANQRDDRVSDCMTATGVRKSEATAGWMALPELIRGRSRQSK